MTNSKMAKVKSLAKDTALFTISSFSSKFLLFILTPLYTSVLSTKQFGIVDLINTTINFVYPLFTLSIAEATLRYSMEKGISKKSVLSNSLVIVFCSYAAVILCKPLIRLIDESLNEYWAYYICIYCLCNLNLVLSNFIKGIGKTALYSLAGVLQAVLVILSNILFLVVLKFNIHGYLWSIIIGYAISTLIMFIFGRPNTNVIPIKIDRSLLKEMLIYSIPMIPTMIAWSINTSIDKFMIIKMINMSENGIYSVAYRIPSILTTVLSIFLSAWQLSAIANHKEKDESDFQTEIYRVFNIAGLNVCFLLLTANRFLAGLLFATNFDYAWHYVPFLIAAALFSALSGFLAAAYRAEKRTKSLFISVMVGAVINIVLNFILLNLLGVLGAAIATAVGFFVVWLVRLILVQRIVPIKIDITKTVLSYFLFFLAVMFESTGSPISLYVSVASLLIVNLINFKEIKRICNFFVGNIQRKIQLHS